jgi:flagellin-specific chaperone FliS
VIATTSRNIADLHCIGNYMLSRLYESNFKKNIKKLQALPLIRKEGVGEVGL